MNLEQRVLDLAFICTGLSYEVAELERRATRYRNALLLMVVGICAVAVVGATTDDGVIRGRELRYPTP